jgi:hypothetical protein
VLSALRLVLRIIAKVNQRVVALRADHDDIATATAVAARRTAAWNELLASESHAAVAAVASFDTNFCFIDEHEEPVVRSLLSMVRLTKARPEP